LAAARYCSTTNGKHRERDVSELERLQRVRDVAKQVYDTAERALASARYTLNFAERAVKAEWDKVCNQRENTP
jgi:hypothetical protein